MTALELLEKMKSVRSMTVGDNMIDKYVFCTTNRLCPEAPVPVLVPLQTAIRNGGAAHVSDQLQALCASSWNFFSTSPTTKTRYMVGHHLIMRFDEDKGVAFTSAQRIEGLAKHFKENPKYDVVVISDYAKGMITNEFSAWIIEYCRKEKIPVIVDPKGSKWSKYQGCDLICPNMAELKAWDDGAAGLFPFMLLKCGEQGLTLYQPSGATEYPAKAKHVFDVTGAGDVVVAVAAAIIGAGGTLTQAAAISNIAAGWSVGEVGTVIITHEKLTELVKATGVEIE
jgi:D-beta-D-heptose 7-phosphate kinase / D-beta-D-heptose 1-phosphate adenosyltransferase